MKKEFFDTMLPVMTKNQDVYLLFCGLGYPRYDEFKERFGDRAINCEASEQTALDIAVGLAYCNKIPFVYTITPFFYRGFETIRTYINYEVLNVKLIGAGRNDDYSKHDGFSHDAKDIVRLFYPFTMFENIKALYPKLEDKMVDVIDIMLKDKHPYFLSLRK